MPVRLRRAYDAPLPDDGRRVLVDRLWPRGRSKEALAIADWLRDLAPSDALRRWFGHDPARWSEFRRRYLDELARPEARQQLDDLARTAREGTLTLVYGAADPDHNQAVVLRDAIEARSRPSR